MLREPKNAKLSQPTHKVRLMADVKVSMRDGVRLSADVYLPDGPGPFPVILMRTPYGKNAEVFARPAIYFARRGYAVVIQDCRGRWDSEGEWYPVVHEAEDGHDTLEWAGTQPWSTGKVGMSGQSYLGLVQWQAAPLRSRYLVCMVPRVAYSNMYHNWVYTGGAFQLGLNVRWAAVTMRTRTNQTHYLWFPENIHLNSLYAHLPLIDIDEAAGKAIQFWKDWIHHSSYDDYWRTVRPVEEHYPEIEAPAYGLGGWYDVFLQSTLNNYMGVTLHGRTPQTRRSQKVLIGPWIHHLGNDGTESRTGDIDFGPEALVALQAEELRWFDYWLKGADNGIMDEPPVRVFVMGANRWRLAQQWPLAETHYTKYYLHSGGRANSLFGNGTLDTVLPTQEPPDQYDYDPHNPTPTLGGSTCCSEEVTPVPMGPRDQRHVEWRPDVLVYTTRPLERDLEVTGPVSVTLYAASSARDTDWTAKLVDVYPDGRAINVAQGILRARYRDSWERPSLLEPGRTYKYTIDLWSTSNCFKAGHRIRVDIASSNFPQFDRNPNTGNPFGMDAELQTAHQTVYHDAEHASHFLLPVIP